MRILFCGDIVPGGVLPYQDDFCDSKIKRFFDEADLRVGTLECAIGEDLPFDKKKMSLTPGKNIVYSRDPDLIRIQKMRFDVLSLANNHIFDLGAAGLMNTISLLDELGIMHCGAGKNLEEASKPCIVVNNSYTIAFIACSFLGLPPWIVEGATPDSPGIFHTDRAGIVKAITSAKKKADFVIVLPHWGEEYHYIQSNEIRNLAVEMINAGADAVFGSHTHIINPRMFYKGKPIFFSLGNFLFPDFCLQPPRPIYYPSSVEVVNNLPVHINYPTEISVPTKVVWDETSRVGIVASMELTKDKKSVHYDLVYLNKNNVLGFPKGRLLFRESVRMCLLNFFYGHKAPYFILRLYYSRFNVLRRLFFKK